MIKSGHFELSTVSVVANFLFETPKFGYYEVIASIHGKFFWLNSIYGSL